MNHQNLWLFSLESFSPTWKTWFIIIIKHFPQLFIVFKDWYAYHRIFICLENLVETAHCSLDKACIINVILQIYCWFINCTVVNWINPFDGSTFPLLRKKSTPLSCTILCRPKNVVVIAIANRAEAVMTQ